MLGEHDGHWLFTIGQRRGLNVSADRPLYVAERRSADNTVVVASADALETTEVRLAGLVDRGLAATPQESLAVQLRYRSAAVPVAAVEPLPGRRALVRLSAPFVAPAPGQAAVFYDDDVVVGHGVIASAAL